MTSKRAVGQTISIRGYQIVARAVEEGVRIGVARAHKHDDQPTLGQIEDHVEREVLNALCEVLEFSDDGE